MKQLKVWNRNVLTRAGKWWKKLNNPSSGMYQLTHAARPYANSGKPFDPSQVVRILKGTKRQVIQDHREAVKDL